MVSQATPMADPKTRTVHIDTELHEKATLICSRRRATSGRLLKITELIDSLIRKDIERMYREVLKELAQKAEEEDRSKEKDKPKKS